jgi:hypothetical protein
MVKKSTFLFRLVWANALLLVVAVGCKDGGKNGGNGSDSLTTKGYAPKPVDSNAVDFVVDTAIDGRKRFKTVGGKYGFYGRNGEVVIPAQFSTAFDFKDGYAKVKRDGKFGYIDTTGKAVIPFSYDKLMSYGEGKVAAQVDGKWGFLDMNNVMVIPAVYDSTQPFGEGLAPVLRDSLYWEYIDAKGKVVIGKDKKLEAAWPFSEGLAHGMRKGMWGFYDKKGKDVIPFRYYNVGRFENGTAPAQIETQWTRIDKKGNCVMNCEIQEGGHEGHDHEGHDHGHEGHDHEH